jgi:hypothetical protein
MLGAFKSNGIDLIKRQLIYYFKNKSDKQQDLLLRLLTNQDSGFSNATVVGQSVSEFKPLDISYTNSYKEGLLKIELKPGAVNAVILNWESSSKQEFDSYNLEFIKQPGIENFPLKVTFKPWNKLLFGIQPELVLTNDNVYEYNSVLSKSVEFVLTIKDK